MSIKVIEKYKHVTPLNDENTVHKMLQIMISSDKEQLAKLFAHSKSAGRMYLFQHDDFPGKVLEYVPGNAGDDSVTTLYRGHAIFQSRQALIDARVAIIDAIEYVLMAVPNTTVVMDEGRNREVHLTELGTAQLLDTLIHFNQTSPTIVSAS